MKGLSLQPSSSFYRSSPVDSSAHPQQQHPRQRQIRRRRGGGDFYSSSYCLGTAIICFATVFLAMKHHFLSNQEDSQQALQQSRRHLHLLEQENQHLKGRQQQEQQQPKSIASSIDRLRTEAQQILAQVNITCQLTPLSTLSYNNNSYYNLQHIFYNRIGKAGSSTLLSMFKESVDRGNNVRVVQFTDRGSDEFLTRQGELELMQKIVGGRKLPLPLPNARSNNHANHTNNKTRTPHRTVFVFHSFFLNFTRYQLPQPIYINLMRDPAIRYASQYEFWKTLRDIGPLVKHYAPSLHFCLSKTKLQQSDHHDHNVNDDDDKGHAIGCPPLNYQTSYLCGHEPDCHDPPTEASFWQAFRHVVYNYALVGTLENLADFQEQVVALLAEDWLAKPDGVRRWQQPPGKGRIVNRNQQNHHQERTEEEWTALREANMYDTVLYDVVKQISAKRLKACREMAKE